MESYFLVLLFLLMVAALTSGYPVAFALPGSAILAISIAALAGYFFEGNPSAYFTQGGPNQWLSAGITNFRSLYWDVERDTLIAVPLFIFMGIMLQRSNIAEDLLVAMAQLFGPIPGGLGISVVFVGALLAATTGIVGATVIAMGLISLPAMLKNNYSKSLASGTVCASGTLGQIIPPSIVLIILADQLSNAADQANTNRQAAYRAITGEFSMPSSFDVVSASAGDMFMGAFIPGLVLVGLYMAYILIVALINPKNAPAIPFEGKYDINFLGRTLMALVPPLSLIFIVLGSIILGVATVNQAGAIGAIGAIVMGGYRLATSKKGVYTPLVITLTSILLIIILQNIFALNIKNMQSTTDVIGIILGLMAATGLFAGVIWSTWRTYKIDNTLKEVGIETVKITSMVFIILIGATMLTSAFRAFGGEELVKEFLTSLPGGFWMQFIVVMVVIFLLGFFLDFIEISVVVVPIVAPILLLNPGSNITAVWLGVMIGMNLQTSFLTPPFGFALFYLRGVAPVSVKTTHIYKGAVAFITLQLVGLGIAGAFPSLVNYLPNRIHLTATTAPPPMNPKLQLCMEEKLFLDYDSQGETLRAAIEKAKRLDISYLPANYKRSLSEGFTDAGKTFNLVEKARTAEKNLNSAIPDYRPIHIKVRGLQEDIRGIEEKVKENEKHHRLLSSENREADLLQTLQTKIDAYKNDQEEIKKQIPEEWGEKRKDFVTLTTAEKKAKRVYRQNVDGAYESLINFQKVLNSTEKLVLMKQPMIDLEPVILNAPPEEAMNKVKIVEQEIAGLAGASHIKSKISKARRALKKKDNPQREKALDNLNKALELYEMEMIWRNRAIKELARGLNEYENAIQHTIGLRMQERLPKEQAKEVAVCLSVHRDISLNF
ncbi:MAG: TRAP transporter large permease subunit [Deltaproteobacteria bacterium]|nr:TRAP transporter large permease subunit [Deltaproteobacteria bacterium]MBT4265367.1 TRAP transporter large permease subunit [Deltaproteobacteria bacterium]